MVWQDATVMAQAVRAGEVSALELVDQAIDRVERLNPKLNAVVFKQYEAARKLAETGDFSQQPFAGVPILLKDLGQEQAGQPSTAGSRLIANYRADRSSHYTEALERLGFIVIGRSNTPEFGFKNISDSQLHGAVSLPFDEHRNAGGSSGGAAAAVAAGMVPLAAASDGGGSIRIPASFNGLIGLKPSRGRIPVGPGSYRGWQGAAGDFALTRSVRDTRRLLYHLQVCQMESPFVLPTLSKEALFQVDTSRPLKIAVLDRSPIGTAVSDNARRALTKAADLLSREGHDIVALKAYPLDGIEAMKTYYIVTAVETAAMLGQLEVGLGRQLMADDMELMSWALYQAGKKVSAASYSQVLSTWDRYSAVIADFHESYDLCLTPATADTAPLQGQFALSEDFQDKLRQMADYSMAEQQDLIWEMYADSLAWTPFTQQANLTGQPAISLPVYRTEQGLPLGVQLTAAKGREDLLLQVAQIFERRQGLIHLDEY